MFLVRNDANFRCALVWKGKPHLEIYSKDPQADGAISPGVRDFLQTKCKDLVEENNVGDKEENSK